MTDDESELKAGDWVVIESPIWRDKFIHREVVKITSNSLLLRNPKYLDDRRFMKDRNPIRGVFDNELQARYAADDLTSLVRKINDEALESRLAAYAQIKQKGLT